MIRNPPEKSSGFVRQRGFECSFPPSESWVILSPIEQSIKRKIEAVGTPLKDWDVSINYGIKTGCNEAFIVDEKRRAEILSWCKTPAERRKTDELIRPILRGRDIKRYGYDRKSKIFSLSYEGDPAVHAPTRIYLPTAPKKIFSTKKYRLEAQNGAYLLQVYAGKGPCVVSAEF